MCLASYWNKAFSPQISLELLFVRLTDCRYCGRAEIAFPASILAEELRRELEATGSLAGIDEHEIEAVRQREARRLHKPSRPRRWWQRWWWH